MLTDVLALLLGFHGQILPSFARSYEAPGLSPGALGFFSAWIALHCVFCEYAETPFCQGVTVGCRVLPRDAGIPEPCSG